jgi:hypothetical protein
MRYLNVINDLTLSLDVNLYKGIFLGCFMHRPQMWIGHMALPLGFHLDLVEF